MRTIWARHKNEEEQKFRTLCCHLHESHDKPIHRTSIVIVIQRYACVFKVVKVLEMSLILWFH